jgi:hypothetical protein
MNYTNNPMTVEQFPVLVPVARAIEEPVRIEVRGEEVIYPKIYTQNNNINNNNNSNNNFWVNAKFWGEMSLLVMTGLAFVSAFILFLIWLNKPDLFGPTN